MTVDVFLSFLVLSFLVELTPGPNMVYLALASATEGRRVGFAMVAGVSLGLAIVGLAAALGLAAVIASSPVLFQVLRWGGVAYLLWLAWDGWHGDGEEAPDGMNGAHRRYFTRGLVTNLLNPKAGIFYVAVLPGFVDPAASIIPQTLALSLGYVAVATGVHATIVLLAGSASRLLADPQRNRLARRVFAVLLAAIAVWLAWSTRS